MGKFWEENAYCSIEWKGVVWKRNFGFDRTTVGREGVMEEEQRKIGVTVRLDRGDYERWKDVAKRERRSLSGMVRIAVELYMREEGK